MNVTALREAVRVGLRGRNDGAVVVSWVWLGGIAGDRRNHLEEGLEWNRLAEAMIARLGGQDALELRRLSSLAAIYDVNDRPHESEETARRMLALAERTTKPDSQEIASALDLLSGALAELGHGEESVALGERVLAIHERAGLGASPSNARALYNLALTLESLQRLKEAEALVRRAIAINEKTLPPDHPNLVGDLLMQASILCQLERYEEAKPVLDRVAPMAERHRDVLPNGAPQIPWLRGEIELGQGRPARAIPLLERALADKDLKAGGDRGGAQFSLARALWASGGSRRRALSQAAAAKVELERDAQPDPLELRRLADWTAAHRAR